MQAREQEKSAMLVRQWSGFAMFLGIVGGAMIGALAGPLIRIGMIKVWRRHLEVP
jgi:hypothetical protein